MMGSFSGRNGGLRGGLAALGVWTVLSVSLHAPPARAEPAACLSPDPAQWPPPARPYFLVVFDTSGSMIQCTNPPTSFPNPCPFNATPNSCGLLPMRINDGKCALRQLVLAFSEVDYGLMTFDQTLSGCGASPYGCTPYQIDGMGGSEYANGCLIEWNKNGGCTGTGATAKGGVLRVGLPVGPSTAQTVINWTNDDCGGGIELVPGGPTPLNGSLRDAATYLRLPASQSALLPACREVSVILVTDGDESCDGTCTENRAKDAAADLYLNGLNDGTNRRVKVYPIAFAGVSACGKAALDDVARSGQCAPGDSACTGATSAYSAANEAELSIALSKIIAQSMKPEVCNNLDDNCNGCTDEGYAHFCNVQSPMGAPNCCAWATALQRQNCLNGFKATITPGNPQGDLTKLPCTTAAQAQDPALWLCYDPKEKCDNVDNNCAGGVDEGVLKCGNPAHCPVAETCNNEDDDCDGVIDDDGSQVPYSICPKPPCVPYDEICDGCDNDCDGIVDDGMGTVPCGLPSPPNCAGTKDCQLAGQPAPEPGGCLAAPPGGYYSACNNDPQMEVCDGIDNDCDQFIDEGLPSTPCEPAGAPPGLDYGPQSQCKMGTKPCNDSCTGWVGPSSEVCDGIDNDCDGAVDEPPLPGIGDTCGNTTPPCQGGKTECVNGVLECVGGVGPQPEICDGLDNDCDGVPDDAPLDDGPAPGQGGCWPVAGNCCSFQGLSWCPPPGGDCYSLGTLKSPCQAGVLACAGAAGWVCQGGSVPATEVCDGKDNDCDGAIDEGIPSAGPCGTDVGECVPGTIECSGGIMDCVGEIGPTQEICDGLDNDCDGYCDNGVPAGGPCEPVYDKVMFPNAKIGQGACKFGQIECPFNTCSAQCVGGLGPKAEICDGIDNDCDGLVDELGVPPEGISGTKNPFPPPDVTIGDPCGIDVGECKQGAWGCANGLFVCLGGKGPVPETCDCLDNDCNGVVDDDATDAPDGGGGGGELLCGDGKECVQSGPWCECAAPCDQSGEFPCPGGPYKCLEVKDSTTGETKQVPYCVKGEAGHCPGGCADKTVQDASMTLLCAPAGTKVDCYEPPVCVCKPNTPEGQGCQPPCHGVSCGPGSVCTNHGAAAGSCVPDSCEYVPCQGCGEVCKGGQCKTTPCHPDTCPPGQVCKPTSDFDSFTCTPSCADVTCPAGEICKNGACTPTCDPPCAPGLCCSNSLTCLPDKCGQADGGPVCGPGTYCDACTGQCYPDPCVGVVCPAGQLCQGGDCWPGSGAPDAGDDASAGTGGAPGDAGADAVQGYWAVPDGGGGCAMSAPGSRRPSGFALIGVLVALLVRGARRRRSDILVRDSGGRR